MNKTYETAQERRGAARTWAGFRSARISPQTGTLVVVIDQFAGSVEDDGVEDRWATICDDHSTVCSHRTRRLAEYHAAAPLGWCESCREAVEAARVETDCSVCSS